LWHKVLPQGTSCGGFSRFLLFSVLK